MDPSTVPRVQLPTVLLAFMMVTAAATSKHPRGNWSRNDCYRDLGLGELCSLPEDPSLLKVVL